MMNALLKSRKTIIAAGIITFLVLVFLLWPRGERPDPQGPTLLALLRAAEIEAAWPGLDVMTAAEELGTPDAAAAFVQSHVMLQDYSGHVSGPDAVLTTRGGNSEDQAGLLQALIEGMGYATRLREADWPDSIIPRLSGEVRPSPAHDALREFLELLPEDGAGPAQADIARERIQTEVGASLLRLSEVGELAMPRQGARPDRRLIVEYQSESGWVALDPVLASPPPAQLRPAEMTPRAALTARIDLIGPIGSRQTLVSARVDPDSDMLIRFLPANDAQRTLMGAPDPGNIPLWRPVLTQNSGVEVGAPFTPAGRTAPVGEEEREAVPPVPAVTAANIIDVDLSAYPEIALTVETDAPGNSVWAAPHFLLEDNGEAQAVRVLNQPRAPDPIVLLTDVSPSMVVEGRIFAAGELGRAFIAGLRHRQAIALATSAGTPLVQRTMTDLFRAQSVVDEFETGLTLRPGDDLAAGVRAAAGRFFTPGDLIIVTDADLDDTQMEQLAAAVGQTRGRKIFVVPEAAAVRFEGLGDSVFILPEDELAAAALGRQLAQGLGSRLQLTYVSARGEAGDERELALSIPTADIDAQTVYEVPDLSEPRARLELVLTREGEVLGEPRTLTRLGDVDTPWRLMAQHRLFISGGRFHPDALVRRGYGDERFAFELGIEGERPEPVAGPSHALLQLAQGLTTLTELGVGNGLTGSHLQAVLLSASPVRVGDQVIIEQVLDVLADGGMGVAGGAEASLALASAEGVLLDAPSTNAYLLERPDLIEVNPRTPIPEHFPGEAIRTLNGRPGATLVADVEGEAGWLVTAEGVVSTRLLQPAAKGTRAEDLAVPFTQLRNKLSLVSAVAGGVGGMNNAQSMQIGGVAAIIDFNLRMFCYSTVMMGYVSDSIADGEQDLEAWQSSAETKCQIDPEQAEREFIRLLSKAMFDGWAGDLATAGVVDLGPYTYSDTGEALVNVSAGVLINKVNEAADAREEAARRRPAPRPDNFTDDLSQMGGF